MSGEKAWISNGVLADVLVVYAQTSGSACFVIDCDAAGVSRRSAYELLGATVACAHAKKFAMRVAFTRIADYMQVMAAAGLSRALPRARHLECAKVAHYLDGATEIRNVVIARHLFA